MDRPGLCEARATESDVANVSTHLNSWSHDKGAPGKVVAKLMGHTNADVTLNVYTQAMGDSLRTAVDRVGNELFSTVHSDEGSQELSH